MQVSLLNHKSTESTIKNMEVQVGQLAKKLAERSTRSFVANIEKNPKEVARRFSLEAKGGRMLRKKKGLSEYWRM